MSWENQGRQSHGWFGSGTSPQNDDVKGSGGADRIFGPANAGRRVDYVAFSLVGHAPPGERNRWNAAVGDTARENLKTAVAAWYGASSLSRDAFRQKFLDPFANDETVDRLRSAAREMIEAKSYAELGQAGEDLATAAQQIGAGRWPRYLNEAGKRAVAAVSDGAVPGVVKASTAGTDLGVGSIVLGVLLVLLGLKSHGSGPARPTITPSIPTNAPPEKGNGASNVPSGTLAKPGEATLAEDRRTHILDGDGKDQGGHGPGRGTPGKSEFPSDWSDEKAIEVVQDVANDPASVRTLLESGRTSVTGTREGVDVMVLIGRDGKSIITAYPTNTPRNRK